MFYRNGKPTDGAPQVGDTLSNGLMIKLTEHIKDGLALVTLDDNTERVWLSAYRLENAPDAVELDEAFADIQDLEAILKWYDIAYSPYCAYTGEYRDKEMRHEKYPQQCSVWVQLRDGREKRWLAICNDEGHIEQVTTDDGTVLKTLAELRATGIVEAVLINEYDIVDF